jgi:hypothetical protein
MKMTIVERLNIIGTGRHLDLADIVCSDAVSEIERLEARIEELEKACHDDPRYEAVWALHQKHAGPYQGPQYANELYAAQAALEERK